MTTFPTWNSLSRSSRGTSALWTNDTVTSPTHLPHAADPRLKNRTTMLRTFCLDTDRNWKLKKRRKRTERKEKEKRKQEKEKTPTKLEKWNSGLLTAWRSWGVVLSQQNGRCSLTVVPVTTSWPRLSLTIYGFVRTVPWPQSQLEFFPNNKPWVTKDLKTYLNKKK